MKGYPSTSLSLYVVPKICEPLACQPIVTSAKENQHLATLDLADYSNGKSRPGCRHPDRLRPLLGLGHGGSMSREQGPHCYTPQAGMGVVRSPHSRGS